VVTGTYHKFWKRRKL